MSDRRVLEIDVGNTFLKWRVVDDNGSVTQRGRVSSKESLVALPQQWPAGLQQARVGSVAAPALDEALRSLLESVGLNQIDFARTQAAAAGVFNSYAQPERMGVDRWLAMLAAWRRCQSACCVVDCGSAITVDFLDAGGYHQGGYILPGMRLLREALLGNTARVFAGEAGGFDPSPGRDTSAAVLQGADFIFESIQLGVQRRLQQMSVSRLLVTGGDGELFQRLIGQGDYLPELVLDGLRPALEG